MDDQKRIQEALDHIDPSRLSYQEWIEIGMALKVEGLPCSAWDAWSMKDFGRYKPGDCLRKWNTFDGSGVSAGTIFHIAEAYGGYTPVKKWTFDDYLPAEAENYEEIIATASPEKDKPYQMAIQYLETLFEPDDFVGYVHSAQYDEKRDKWIPANAGIWRRRDDIIKDLKKYRKLDTAFGTVNEEAGAWIRINPLDGKGAADANVTRYDYALAEADTMPIEDQKKLLINLKLPIAALVESGGKSVHAVVKIGASNEQEFKQRVTFLFSELAKRNFIVDTNNSNPSRLSRLPGAMRKGKCQKLIATNIGCASWEEWIDELNGINDDLPPILDFWDQMQDPPQLSPELIGGILREGNKMIITGESKAGKTCLSQELAVCIAEGKPWLGKFKCEQGKVLYMNLEVEEASLFYRFKTIYEANGWKIGENAHNIHPWNLRGKALPLDKLADKVIRRCRGQHYKLIILDPLYKVQQGDENSAEAISTFCNALDKIAHETGAAIVYDHHHPKGGTGDRKVTDRGSGSGVFARDADAICDLSFLSPSKELMQVVGAQMQSGEKPMQIAFVLRDFKDVEPINIWFKFPCHYVDSANLLDGAPLEGSKEDHLNKSSKRTTDDEKHIALTEAFECCKEQDGTALIKEMAEFTNGHPARRTLERYIERFSDEFELKDGVVRRLK
jgi:RecA-family ATPase